jgi:hypothetical protein
MLHELAPDDPDIQTIKRAAGVMTSRIRKARRREAREAAMAPGREHDKRVLESTATGSPERIDDETRGIPLAAQGDSPYAGELTPVAPPSVTANATSTPTCAGSGRC